MAFLNSKKGLLFVFFLSSIFLLPHITSVSAQSPSWWNRYVPKCVPKRISCPTACGLGYRYIYDGCYSGRICQATRPCTPTPTKIPLPSPIPTTTPSPKPTVTLTSTPAPTPIPDTVCQWKCSFPNGCRNVCTYCKLSCNSACGQSGYNTKDSCGRVRVCPATPSCGPTLTPTPKPLLTTPTPIIGCIVAPPTNLNLYCKGSVAFATWTASPCADSYELVADDTINAWSGSCNTLNPGDYCFSTPSTSYMAPTNPTSTYNWTVQSRKGNALSKAISGPLFTCGITPPVPSTIPSIPQPSCYPVHVSCQQVCGQSEMCTSDGCGGKTCCPASPPCTTPIVKPTRLPTYTAFCAKHAQGDANCDNVVDKNDFDTLIYMLRGLKGTCMGCSADFNKDGQINGLDFEILRKTVYN